MSIPTARRCTTPISFAELLRRLDQVPGDYRIRFMTSHPKDATHELIDAIASGTHISHHLHLPFQSGNDRILQEMNRHYDREKYLSLIRYAKEKIPGSLPDVRCHRRLPRGNV